MARHLGNAEQPQNWLPACGPFLLVRSTMTLPHLGQDFESGDCKASLLAMISFIDGVRHELLSCSRVTFLLLIPSQQLCGIWEMRSNPRIDFLLEIKETLPFYGLR